MGEARDEVTWLAGHYMFGWTAAINYWQRTQLPAWVRPEVETANRAGYDAGRQAMADAEAAALAWARDQLAAAAPAEKR